MAGKWPWVQAHWVCACEAQAHPSCVHEHCLELLLSPPPPHKLGLGTVNGVHLLLTGVGGVQAHYLGPMAHAEQSNEPSHTLLGRVLVKLAVKLSRNAGQASQAVSNWLTPLVMWGWCTLPTPNHLLKTAPNSSLNI